MPSFIRLRRALLAWFLTLAGLSMTASPVLAAPTVVAAAVADTDFRDPEPWTTTKAVKDAAAAEAAGDFTKAFDLLEAAGEAGDVKAQYQLGRMYNLGAGGRRDRALALKWYERAAAKGDAFAQGDLGLLLLRGGGGPSDTARAEALLLSSSEAAPAAASNLCVFYASNPATAAKAQPWCRKAGRAGQPAADLFMGWLYADGIGGLPRDPAMALPWLIAAAERGNAAAQETLGRFYVGGFGLPKDPEAALGWFAEAARAGNARAQFDMGVTLENGFGVSASLTDAMGWYQRSADAGYPAALGRVGQAYLTGAGKPKDPVQATAWFRKAAEAGEPRTWRVLGVRLARGEGAPANPVEALMWLKLAETHAQGLQPDPEAAETARKLRASLAAGEISKAEAQAAAWRPGCGFTCDAPVAPTVKPPVAVR